MSHTSLILHKQLNTKQYNCNSSEVMLGCCWDFGLSHVSLNISPDNKTMYFI